MPGQAPPYVPDDPLVVILQTVARLDERLVAVLDRMNKVEALLAGGDQDVLRRLTAIEDAQRASEQKRDDARAAHSREHAEVLKRLEAVEARQEAAAAQARWRWSAWQVLVGLAAFAGAVVGVVFAIADHT